MRVKLTFTMDASGRICGITAEPILENTVKDGRIIKTVDQQGAVVPRTLYTSKEATGGVYECNEVITVKEIVARGFLNMDAGIPVTL